MHALRQPQPFKRDNVIARAQLSLDKPSTSSCRPLPSPGNSKRRLSRSLFASATAEFVASKPPGKEFAVSVRGLNHTFKHQVLKDTDFDVTRGHLHILAGANGCGKSTLLRIIGGLLPKQSGQVQIEAPVGMVLQNPDHQIVMPTVAADVAFGLGRYNLSKATVRKLVKEALQIVKLGDFGDRPTNTLSGGEKQRVAIAGALAQYPKVLLLDELTTFLDAAGQQSVMQAVRSAVDGPRKVTAIWVTHRLEELKGADSASFMENGKIEISGSPESVTSYMRKLGATI